MTATYSDFNMYGQASAAQRQVRRRRCPTVTGDCTGLEEKTHAVTWQKHDMSHVLVTDSHKGETGKGVPVLSEWGPGPA